ncbi:MAG: hypothetical protein GX790_02200 [Syntrophomonadaceae bacterium]|nr:hypothetical protein [Syntrophomonadaceae bacterium]
MSVNDTNIKKIYNETASVIMKLCFDKKITEPEMYFLLNLLEFIWQGNKSDELVNVLSEWQSKNRHSEIDEIIKHTLLTIDFNNHEIIDKITQMIKELLAAEEDEEDKD